MLCSTLLTPCVAIESQHVLNPLSAVKWAGCGEINNHTVECARIDVPMDHFNKSGSDKTFSLPLIRMLGTNTSATGGKSILFNPGGPGASGINFMWRLGEHLNKIIGEGFHILSFDPRGVSGSIPQAICYADDAERLEQIKSNPWNIDFEAGEMFTRAENKVKACIDTMGDHGLYMNTPQTAADMNSILDAIGQEHMYYWGISYGTTLGQTYAQMFPDRVARLMIDGVSSLDEWYNSFFFDEWLTDTDNVYAGFVEECFKAKENCPLNSIKERAFETAGELQDYIDDFLQKLDEEPIPVYLNSSNYGSVTRRTVVGNGIVGSLYNPAINWPTLAKNLAELISGNATSAFNAYSKLWTLSIIPDETSTFVTGNDNWKAGLAAPVHGKKEIQNYTLSLTEESRLISRYLVSDLFDRASWSIPKTHDFHPHYYPEYPRFKTANPILVLSTTYDPVCPLISAKKAHNSFEGAGFLRQKSYGHCSYSMPSICTGKHINRYFNEGKLPEPGATCDIDAEYFPAPVDFSTHIVKDLSHEDEELLAALRGLASKGLDDNIWSRRSHRLFV